MQERLLISTDLGIYEENSADFGYFSENQNNI
jgi:hypothetical protein